MVRNKEFLDHVLQTLISITSRRSSESMAGTLMSQILGSLMPRYPFLRHVSVKNAAYFEQNVVTVSPEINSVAPHEIGQVVQSMARMFCLDLEEESGLFFIREFRDKLGESAIVQCPYFGIDLDLLQLEQLHLHEQVEKSRTLVQRDPRPLQTHLLTYTWENVASFKYRNNVCFVYDRDGKLLDKMKVNDLLEFYVRTITDFERFTKKEERLDITEKEVELLIILHTKDVDKEFAKYLLHVSEDEFCHMIKRLLKYELLQSISEDEVKLTEKGVAFIENWQQVKHA